MIANERQYAITRKELTNFEAVLSELRMKQPPQTDLNEQIRHQLQIDAIASQIESFQEEIDEYEYLKLGKVEKLNFDSLQQLPEALIKARIARGLTQKQLASLLRLKEQQIQQYESTLYANASLSRLIEIKDALNIEIKEEVIFK
jgi:HTH-type transcriptional regulator / antitoxin HipB